MRKHIGSLIFLISITCSLSSQVVNKGILYISEGDIFSSYQDILNQSIYDFASGTIIQKGEITNNANFYLFANYVNQGSILSNSNFVDTTFFVGVKGVQSIGGDSVINVANAAFNNKSISYVINPASATYHLGTSMWVTSHLLLNSGIIDAQSYGGSMTIERSVSGASDRSYIYGNVIRPFGDDFTYPIGDGGYLRPLIKTNAGGQAQFDTASYFYANPGNTQLKDIDVITVDTAEYWTFSTSQTQVAIDIEIGWDRRTTPATLIADPVYAWSIVRWDVASNKWISYPSTVNAITQTVKATIDHNGKFTLARTNTNLSKNLTLHTSVPAVAIALDCNNDGGNYDYCGDDEDYIHPNQIGVDTMKNEVQIFITSDQPTVTIDFNTPSSIVGLYQAYQTQDLSSSTLRTPINSGSVITLFKNVDSVSSYSGFVIIIRDKYKDPTAEGKLLVAITAGTIVKSQTVLFSNDFDNDGFPNAMERSTCIKKVNGTFNEWYFTYPEYDVDHDGITNGVEAGGSWDSLYYKDTNHNCIPDFMDPDSNGDGVPDKNKKFTEDVTDTTVFVKVRQAVSPNGDGLGDDKLMIEYINRYPDNEFTLFDRVGRILYFTKEYNNRNNAFDGFPNRAGNVQKRVPMGTYYYYLVFYSGANRIKNERSGFIEVRY